MAVAFRSAGTLATSSGGAATVVSYPSGVASGDLLLLQFTTNPGHTASTPSGWTLLLGPVNMSGSGNKCYVFWKLAGGSEPSTVSVTITNQGAGIMAAFTGAHASTPIDVSANATLPSGGQTTGTTPSVTTTVTNTMLVRMTWRWGGGTISPPGSDTERWEDYWAAQDVRIEAATSTQAGTGASGTTTATSTGNHFGGLGATIAIAPATAVAPVANFTGTPLTGDAPLNVAFTDTSSNTPTSWSWDFGDTGTSTSQNPSHNYTVPGTYDVELVATNAGGSDTETKVGYVTVNVPPDPLAYAEAGGITIG